jgi:molybdopterin-containing oxidoreductase family membrane subunit
LHRVSAFTAGPGLMIVAFQVIRRYTKYAIGDEALRILRQIVTVSLLVNLFLLGCEAFKEFYAESVHSSSARYLFFGLDG